MSQKYRPFSLFKLTLGLMLAISLFVPVANAGKIEIFDKLPIGRADAPAPSDANLLFYIQRSNNANTVVYAARLKSDGALDRKKPVKVFWRRFAKKGNKRKLGFLERRLAYGVVSKPIRKRDKVYRVKLKSYPARSSEVSIGADGKPIAIIKIGKHKTRLVFAYVKLKNNNKIPDIAYVDVIGQDLKSGKFIRERIRPKKKNSRRQRAKTSK